MSLGRADPEHSGIHAATSADAAAIACVHAAAWQAAFSSFLPADFLAGSNQAADREALHGDSRFVACEMAWAGGVILATRRRDSA